MFSPLIELILVLHSVRAVHGQREPVDCRYVELFVNIQRQKGSKVRNLLQRRQIQRVGAQVPVLVRAERKQHYLIGLVNEQLVGELVHRNLQNGSVRLPNYLLEWRLLVITHSTHEGRVVLHQNRQLQPKVHHLYLA